MFALYLVLYLAIGFCGFFGLLLKAHSPFLFFGIWFVVGIVLLLVSYAFSVSPKCPRCGKHFAAKEIERKLVSTRQTTRDVERTVKNRDYRVVGRYTEAVPATEYVYDCICQCSACGHKYTVQVSEIK